MKLQDFQINHQFYIMKNNIKQELEKYSEKYLPLIWKVDGPYLYISNKGFEDLKEDGLCHYPSISAISKQKGIDAYIKDGKKWIDMMSKMYLGSEPEEYSEPGKSSTNIVDLNFKKEFLNILKPLREEYEKNKSKKY